MMSKQQRSFVYPGKFSIPPCVSNRIIYREKLIAEHFPGTRDCRLLLVEAQAGQGKTTFVSQLVNYFNEATGWIQLGSEDLNPFALIRTLYDCLQHTVPGFSSPALLTNLKSIKNSNFDVNSCVDLLADAIVRHIKQPFWQIIDDLHLLDDTIHSSSIFNRLLEKTGPFFRLILVSRNKIDPLYFSALPDSALVRFDNTKLSFSVEDTLRLYSDVFDLSLPHRSILALHQATDGWVSGLLVEGYALQGSSESKHPASTNYYVELRRRRLEEYFAISLFPLIDTQTLRSLKTLSLLEVVPLSLAKHLVPKESPFLQILNMTENNQFVRYQQGHQDELVLHHLFRDTLRNLAEQEFGHQEISEIYSQVAEYFLLKENFEEALFYYLNAGDFRNADNLLSRHGMSLLYDNALGRLKGHCEKVSPTDQHDFGWLSFFLGIIFLDDSPPTAKSYLNSACDTFHRTGDQIGKLLTQSQLLHYYAFIECCYASGSLLVEHVNELSCDTLKTLDYLLSIHIAVNLSIGFNFITCDYSRTMQYLQLAGDLAAKQSNDNIESSICFMRGMAANMNGKLATFGEEIERSSRFLYNDNVGFFNKLLLHSMVTNYYFWLGDNDNFHRQSDETYRCCAGNAIAMSSIDPWQLVMKADLCIGRDEISAARAYIDQAMQKGFASNLPHLQSQILQTHALLLALDGSNDEAKKVAETSARARDEAGGDFFRLWNDCMLSATYVTIDDNSCAENHLQRAICLGRQLGIAPLLASALALNACRLLKSDTAQASGMIAEALGIMRREDLRNFFGWEPRLMREVLQFAVHSNIETDYARMLLRERLETYVDNGGELQPLFRIRVFGSLRISLAGRSLEADALTPAQRHFLTLLIGASGNRLSQEKIQDSLWPDKTRENAQGAFDVLLSRFRKTLGNTFGKENVNGFVKSKRGIVSLENCLIDTVEFERFSEAGLKLLHKGKYWSSRSTLHHALKLVQDGVAIDTFGCNRINDYLYRLEFLYESISMEWGAYMREIGNLKEALQLLHRCRHAAPDNFTFTRDLYHTLLLAGEKIHAKKLLNDYADRLLADEYSAQEIEETLQELKFYDIRH